MQFISIVSILLIVSQAFALKYTDCGSNLGEIQDVRLTGCEDRDVCELKRGETYTYGLTFKSFTNSQNLRAVLHGIINDVSHHYPLPNPNICETHDVECPIKSGEVYNFEKTLEVSRSFPPMEVDVQWELKDDNNENVVCGIIPVQIV